MFSMCYMLRLHVLGCNATYWMNGLLTTKIRPSHLKTMVTSHPVIRHNIAKRQRPQPHHQESLKI